MSIRRLGRWLGRAAFAVLVDCGGWLGFAPSAYLWSESDKEPVPPGYRPAAPLTAQERTAWQDITRHLSASRVRE